MRVLLIEDDEIDRMAFKRMLAAEKLPFEFYFACSVAEARQLLLKETFDVVVADYKLNDGTSFDLFDIMGETPFIFTTGGGDEETAVKALRSGAFDYLIKDHQRNYLKMLPIALEKAVKQKLMNERLRLMEAAVLNSQDAVVITNADIDNLKIEFHNQAFERISGRTSEDILGKSPKILQGPNTQRVELDKIRQKLSAAQFVSAELINYDLQGREYWVDMNIVPLIGVDGKVTHFMSIQRDITQRKKTEEELLLAKKQAEAAQEAEKMFLANMSHEIRTPMNAVIGMTHFLMESKPTDEQLDYLRALKFSADNLLDLINDVLDFSKIEAGQLQLEKEPFHLPNLMNEIINSFKYKMKQNLDVKIITNINPELPNWLLGDSTRFTQILNNLLGNAGKFTKKGEIQIFVNPLNNTSVPNLEDDYWVEVKISDTGIGMSETTMATIFNKFKQADTSTSRRYGGTGLGLAIVKQIVEIYGGNIKVESKLGFGTTFTFTLPFGQVSDQNAQFILSDAETEEQQRLLAQISGNQDELLRSTRILVVEDHPMNQKLIKLILDQWDCPYELVENGMLALEITRKRPFDLILMDIQMPMLDGYETTKQIRADAKNLNQHTPVIAVSATTIASEKARMQAAGINNFLSKPFTPNKLKKIVLSEINSKYLEKDEINHSQTTRTLYHTRPHFDLTYIKETFGADDIFVKEMVTIFLVENPKDLLNLQKYTQEQNWLMVHKTAHKVKSGYMFLQILDLHHLATSIEKEATKHNLDAKKIAQLVTKLIEGTKHLYPLLEDSIANES